jgi:hypothetical protein
MILDKNLAWLFISIGLIVASPFIAIFSHRVSKYLLDVYVADTVLIITYRDHGKVSSQIKIKTKSDASIAKKIMTRRNAANE